MNGYKESELRIAKHSRQYVADLKRKGYEEVSRETFDGTYTVAEYRNGEGRIAYRLHIMCGSNGCEFIVRKHFLEDGKLTMEWQELVNMIELDEE